MDRSRERPARRARPAVAIGCRCAPAAGADDYASAITPIADAEARSALRGRHHRPLTDGRIVREPADPLFVERVELGRVAQGPVGPDDLLERAAGLLQQRLEVAHALAGLLLDAGPGQATGLGIDRTDSTRRRPSRPAATARPWPVEDPCLIGTPSPSSDPPDRPGPTAHRVGADLLGRDAELARRQLDAMRLELAHEGRSDRRSA